MNFRYGLIVQRLGNMKELIRELADKIRLIRTHKKNKRE